MSFINWHKNYVKKSLNMLGLSNYQGFWISFIKGLIFGAVIMWFVGCNEQVVIKEANENDPSAILQATAAAAAAATIVAVATAEVQQEIKEEVNECEEGQVVVIVLVS